ncbi:MAG: hypothetical protein JO264_05205 [Acidisphaera sp.]|nr:hypothetical protein [Acidisphaera sp.]
MRPTRQFHPRPALKVTLREAELQLHIGEGGWLRLDPRDGTYASEVIGALGSIATDENLAATLERIAAAAQPVLIARPPAATMPPNAWSRPADLRGATAAGLPTGLLDRDGMPVLGTGGGTGSTVSFDPADWLPAQRHRVLHAALREAGMDAQGERQPSSPPPRDKPVELLLSCQPRREAGCLVFPYRLENRSDREVFVMGGVAVEAAVPERRVHQDLAVVLLGSDGDAVLGKVPPPLPLDTRPALPCLPLATMLPSGGVLERLLIVTEPLAESSPLLPPADLQVCEAVEIAGVVFSIAYWTPAGGEQRAVPFPDAPDSHDVSGLGNPARVTQRFPVRGLRMLRRSGGVRKTAPEKGPASSAGGGNGTPPPQRTPSMLTRTAAAGV